MPMQSANQLQLKESGAVFSVLGSSPPQPTSHMSALVARDHELVYYKDSESPNRRNDGCTRNSVAIVRFFGGKTI